MTTKNEAKALVNSLRAGLLAISTALPKIVEARAWEPLGYVSFVELWRTELADLDLSGAPRAAAVYALLEAGATDDDVVECVKGVGEWKVSKYRLAFERAVEPATAERVAQRTSGGRPRIDEAPAAPPVSHDGETWVGGHTRRPPRPQHRVTLSGFTSNELKAWKKAADARELDYRVWLAGLLRDAANEAIGND